jgi:hypothetical protein
VIANKQVLTTVNQHSTTEELLEAGFSVMCIAAVTMQWRGKCVFAAMNQHSVIEELLETVFSTQSVPGGYQWDEFKA